MKKNTLTKEQIEEKKIKLLEKLNQDIEDKKNGVSPTQKFLTELKEIIQKSMENNISFTKLSDNIYSVYNIRVSAQSLRTFASVNLGYKPKIIQAKKEVKSDDKETVKPVEKEVKSDDKNAKTMEEMKSINNKVDF